jgi:DNA-binding NarL/FixJ family response regulator
MSTRLLLVDDHRIIRQGLRALLAATPGMEVVGEAGDGRTAPQLAQRLKPDVVVMDISLPELNGIDATRQLRAAVPTVKVIALSMHSDERYVAGMLRAGAAGYLIKDGAFEELARAIRAVLAGATYLSPRITGVVVDGCMRLPAAVPGERAALTEREREVLQLVAEGRSTKEIAGSLHVSVKTVETHRQHIMERLGLTSVAELTKYAIRIGLTALES